MSPVPPVYAAGEGLLTLTVRDGKTHEPAPAACIWSGPARGPKADPTAPFWYDHFVFPGKIVLKLPIGKYTFELHRGQQSTPVTAISTFDHFAEDSKEITLRRFADLATEGWYSGDLFVRRPVRDADAFDVGRRPARRRVRHLVERQERLDKRPPPKKPLVSFDGNRCYDAMAGGFSRAGTELLYFNLPAPLSQPQTNAGYPSVMKYLLKAREKPNVWVDLTAPYWWDLPMLVALGQVDSIEVAQLATFAAIALVMNESEGKPRDRKLYPNPFGNARWSQVYLLSTLECGLRIPPMRRQRLGRAPNPVGYNRVYVHLDGPFSYDAWWKHFARARSFVTNGPLLRPTVEGEPPGHVFRAEAGQGTRIGNRPEPLDRRPGRAIPTSSKTARSSIRSAWTISARPAGCPSCTSRRAAGFWFVP